MYLINIINIDTHQSLGIQSNQNKNNRNSKVDKKGGAIIIVRSMSQ